ncbi:prepilin peptidase [Ruania zhangjianzhongii]|uniref:prepilin peptidase n=1 Tax=Ruania zhangjianzhongii TaxID=2603206 RepID=UPI001F35848E|nr:A24 family peptidase [Ruania zhangjianzhongii]
MPTELLAAVLCALAAGGLAWAASPALVQMIGARTVWTARRTHVLLAVLGGLAAGLRGPGLSGTGLSGTGLSGTGLSSHSLGETIALTGTAVGLALLVTADLAVHRLPDRLTVPTAGWVLLCWLVLCLTGAPWADLGRALLAGAVLGGAFLLLCLLTPGGLGLGDAKLAGVLGLVLGWFGWLEVLAGVLGAFLLGGLFAMVLLVSRRAGRRTAVAFGPWLVAGAALSLGWAPVLLG